MSAIQKHRDTKTPSHKESRHQITLCLPAFFVAWCLCVLVLTTHVVSYSQAQPQAQVGYAVLTPNVGMPTPVASALFTYSNSSGIIISQAGVGSAPPFLRSRLFVDEKGTRTAVALVNTSSQAATVNMTLRDPGGTVTGQASLTLNPGQHSSRFIFEMFQNLPENFVGSLTLDSNQPISAITLRQRYNSFNEPLYATLPVVDLSAQSIELG